MAKPWATKVDTHTHTHTPTPSKPSSPSPSGRVLSWFLRTLRSRRVGRLHSSAGSACSSLLLTSWNKERCGQGASETASWTRLLPLVSSLSLGRCPPFPALPPKVPSAWLSHPPSLPAPHPHELAQTPQGTDVGRQGPQFVVADDEHSQGQLADVGRQRRQLVSAAGRRKAMGSPSRQKLYRVALLSGSQGGSLRVPCTGTWG